MTREDVKELIKAIMTYYPTFLKEGEDVSEKVDAWYFMLKDDAYEPIVLSLKNYVLNNDSSFAPNIAQLRNMAYNIIHQDDLGVGEAWAMVRNAISNGKYEPIKEFNKLPEVIQKTIGSPDYIRDLAHEFNPQVDQSIFERKYKAELERKKQYEMMPEDVKALIQKTNDKLEQRKHPKLEGIEQMKGK